MRASRGRGSCVAVVGEDGAGCEGPAAGAVGCVLGAVVLPPLVVVFCVGWDWGWVCDWEGPEEELGRMPFVWTVVAMAAMARLGNVRGALAGAKVGDELRWQGGWRLLWIDAAGCDSVRIPPMRGWDVFGLGGRWPDRSCVLSRARESNC